MNSIKGAARTVRDIRCGTSGAGHPAPVGPPNGSEILLIGAIALAGQVALGAGGLSILGMWMGASRKIRLVSGIARRRTA